MRVRLPLLILAVVAFCAHTAWYVPTWTDDAYITLRYARRYAVGEGMTFNAGERLEGITNLGWALGLSAFGDGDLLTVAQWLGALAGVGTVLVMGGWAWRLGSLSFLCALAMLVVPAWVPSWAMQGLETGGVTLLLTAGWVTFLAANKHPSRSTLLAAGICLGAGAWLRPDAAALPFLLGAWQLWTRRLHRGLGWAIAPILLSALALVAVKLVWFGELLPNTFYVKVGQFPPESGLRYLWSYFTRPSPWLPALSALAVARALPWAAARDDRAVPGLVFGAYVLFGVLQNGDFMPNYRFFTPAWPAACAAFALLAEDLGARVRGFSVVCAGLLAVAVTPASRVFLIDRLESAPSAMANLRPAKEAAFFLPQRSPIWGVELLENVPFPTAWTVVNAGPTDTVAYTELGLISYVYDGAVVDLLGLTDRVIAGRAGEPWSARWAYIERRVNWLIVDTRHAAWNRWAGRLRASGWTVVDGCTTVFVFANPALPGVGPSPKERSAAVDTARRRAPRHNGLMTALGNELGVAAERAKAAIGDVGASSGAPSQPCGSRESRIDISRFAGATVWPPAKDEGDGYVARPVAPTVRSVPRVDPSSAPPPTPACVAARARAADAWRRAADVWAGSGGGGGGVGEPTRLARSASRAALRPDALSEAQSALAAARASSATPSARAATEAAMLTTRESEEACTGP